MSSPPVRGYWMRDENGIFTRYEGTSPPPTPFFRNSDRERSRSRSRQGSNIGTRSRCPACDRNRDRNQSTSPHPPRSGFRQRRRKMQSRNRGEVHRNGTDPSTAIEISDDDSDADSNAVHTLNRRQNRRQRRFGGSGAVASRVRRSARLANIASRTNGSDSDSDGDDDDDDDDVTDLTYDSPPAPNALNSNQRGRSDHGDRLRGEGVGITASPRSRSSSRFPQLVRSQSNIGPRGGVRGSGRPRVSANDRVSRVGGPRIAMNERPRRNQLINDIDGDDDDSPNLREFAPDQTGSESEDDDLVILPNTNSNSNSNGNSNSNRNSNRMQWMRVEAVNRDIDRRMNGSGVGGDDVMGLGDNTMARGIIHGHNGRNIHRFIRFVDDRYRMPIGSGARIVAQGLSTKKQKEMISELPTRTLQTVDIREKNCVICLNPYEAGDEVKTLRCFHQFHTECVDRWLLTKMDCPVCRFSIAHGARMTGRR